MGAGTAQLVNYLGRPESGSSESTAAGKVETGLPASQSRIIGVLRVPQPHKPI